MNVEKVVNPPQKPVVKRSRDCGESHDNVDGKLETKPISMQPSRLTINVAKGNEEAQNAPTSFDTRKRLPPPKKLPMPTIKKSLNMFITSNIIQTEHGNRSLLSSVSSHKPHFLS